MPRFLTAAWRNLLMVNFAIDPMALERLLPSGTTLDDFHGEHFVSIVGFQFLESRIRGMPTLCHSAFDEVNLRFYVKREADGELRRGVVFIKELVARRVVAAIANRVYHETYVRVPMRSNIEMPGRVEYGWHCHGRWHGIGAQVTGEPQPAEPASLTEFLIEHYWGYTIRRDNVTAEFRVEHSPWRVWDAKKTWHDIDPDFYGPAFAHALRNKPVSVFVADGSPVTVFQARRLPYEIGHGQNQIAGNSLSAADAGAVGRL
jgi:hypothetical protein